MAIVYIHRRKDIEDPFLNVFYVGISKNYRRPKTKYKRNSMWNRIVRNHGYIIEITHENVCWEEACAIEKYLIFFYGRRDLNLGNLANMTDGGDGAVNYIRSDEQNKAHGEKIKGKNNPMYGRSAQSGKKGFNTGNKHSEETKRKISESGKKRQYKMPEELKRKLSELFKNRTGRNNPNFGRKHSEETKRRISESNKKPKKKKNENSTT